MSKFNIHPSAIVEPGAIVSESVLVGPFSIIESGAQIEDGSSIDSHCVVRRGSKIGKYCKIDSFSVIGGDPQFLGFIQSTNSGVIIGDNTVLREGVTVHRSCYKEKNTIVGEKCLLMANSHVAHDCQIGDSVVLANAVLLAGHVFVGDKTFIGGGAAVHQFARIGAGVMVGGLTVITKDVAPYCMVTGRNAINGLNLIGLKRSGIDRSTIKQLKEAFRYVFSSTNTKVLAQDYWEHLEKSDLHDAIIDFLSFFNSGERGFATFISRKESH